MSDVGLHILEMRGENFMGLRVVELKLDEKGVVVSGENGQGKTSVLTILQAAFGGKGAEPLVPIRLGTFRAQIGLVVGSDGVAKFKVEKEWEDGKPTKLIVTAADGTRVSSPQKLLDSLYHAICFDVAEFLDPPGEKTPEGKARKQAAILLEACPIDIDLKALAANRKRAYDVRTETKRDIDRLAAKLRITTKMDVPARIDLALKQAQLNKAAADAVAVQRDTDRVNAIDRELANLKTRWEELVQERGRVVARAEAASGLVDTKALEAEIVDGLRTNEAAIRATANNEQYEATMKELGEAKRRADELTAEIEKADADKLAALARAQFPVAGLGIDEVLGVTLVQDGAVMPYLQLNMAEKVKIAVAVLAKLAPQLRAVRVDGNCLDNTTLAVLFEAAGARGLQLFVERIAADQPGALVFKAGVLDRVVPEAQP